MQEPLKEIYDDSLEPLIEERISNEIAWENLQKPVKGFMLKNVADKELALFLLNGMKINDSIAKDETPLHVLTPAFMISELRKAFEIGF